MAGAPVEVIPTEMKWYYPLLGLLFASLILGAAIWSAISQVEDSNASGDHSEEVEEDDGH